MLCCESVLEVSFYVDFFQSGGILISFEKIH